MWEKEVPDYQSQETWKGPSSRMRLGEQLRLRKKQVDFLRNIVTPTETKNGKDRDIPMNVEVRVALFELCKNKAWRRLRLRESQDRWTFTRGQEGIQDGLEHRLYRGAQVA